MTIKANPINIGVQLAEASSLEKMVDLCRYYGLTENASEDVFTVYNASDGSRLRFKVYDSDSIAATTVEVYTRQNPKNIAAILEDLLFEKKGNEYQRKIRFEKQFIHCNINFGNPSVLTFTRQQK